MAGNSWQPSHEPPQKAGTHHTEQVSEKRKGGGGGGGETLYTESPRL